MPRAGRSLPTASKPSASHKGSVHKRLRIRVARFAGILRTGSSRTGRTAAPKKSRPASSARAARSTPLRHPPVRAAPARTRQAGHPLPRNRPATATAAALSTRARPNRSSTRRRQDPPSGRCRAPVARAGSGRPSAQACAEMVGATRGWGRLGRWPNAKCGGTLCGCPRCPARSRPRQCLPSNLR